MARPRKEGMDYFPHDVNLSSDKKVEALRIIHGNDGYTFFCIMLELIYQEQDFELDVSDAETIQILAKKVEVTVQKLHEMILTSVKHGCFDRERYENDRVLTSNGIKKRASVVVDKREKMRKSYNPPKSKVSDSVSAAEKGAESAQSKVKEKESKVNIKDTLSSYSENSELIDTIHAFIDFRKKIKAPMTQRAVELMLNELDKLASSDREKVAILNQSIVNGWRGVFELKSGFKQSNRSIVQMPVSETTPEEKERLRNVADRIREKNGVRNAVNK